MDIRHGLIEDDSEKDVGSLLASHNSCCDKSSPPSIPFVPNRVTCGENFSFVYQVDEGSLVVLFELSLSPLFFFFFPSVSFAFFSFLSFSPSLISFLFPFLLSSFFFPFLLAYASLFSRISHLRTLFIPSSP